MGKDVKETPKREERAFDEEELARKRDGLTATLEALRGDLRAFVIGVGYRVFFELLEEERSGVPRISLLHSSSLAAFSEGEVRRTTYLTLAKSTARGLLCWQTSRPRALEVPHGPKAAPVPPARRLSRLQSRRPW